MGGWSGFTAVLFVLLLISDVSTLSFDLNSRKLLASTPANNSAPPQVPPLPNPVPVAENLDPKTNGSDKSSGNSSELNNSPPIPDTRIPNVTAETGPVASDKTDNKSNNEEKDGEKKSSPIQEEETGKKLSPPPGADADKNSSPPEGKENDKNPSPPQAKETEKNPSPPQAKETEKNPSPPQAKETDKNPSPPTGAIETCEGKEKKCQIQNTLTACIQNFGSDSKELEILVQNVGQETFKVDLTVPASAIDDKKDIELLKRQITKVNISNIIGKASKIVLSTGNKECEIDIGIPLPEGNPLFRLPTSEQLLTPINGAYFLIFTAITFGGVWACCKFTKRRRQGSVPYQELEMASPETAGNEESAEGWDEGWDDDWDEENSVKSPVVRLHTSANGLTARPANRDGWDNDWDD